MAHKRGGNRGHNNRTQFGRDVERESARLVNSGSTTALLPDRLGVYLTCSEVEEHTDRNEYGLLIPARKSLTAKQRLSVFPISPETIDLREYKINLKTGKRETVTDETTGNTVDLAWSNPRNLGRVTKSLLKQGLPDVLTVENSGQLKRSTSRTKRITSFREIEIVSYSKDSKDIPIREQINPSESTADSDLLLD